jgi:acetylornithine/N-succinyldiaminopimelate aminotransferase
MITPVLPTYNRAPMAFVTGAGSWLTAEDGRRYLDLGAGIAVNALGHANPDLVAALTEQAGKLWHVSNLYRIPEQEKLAEMLVDKTFADTVFFTNSGTEAAELAIKMARKYHYEKGQPQRNQIITFEGAFHGRTLATLAAGGNKKYLEGFGPVAEGFDQVPFADLEATKRAIGPQTCGILIEPVMGEGGVRVVPHAFLRELRALCDQHGLLLLFDEVQCGMGRMGSLFAYEQSGVKPDVMGIAKGLGGGFPVGAFLATAEAGKGMTPGTHGSTFGGNPLATAVGIAVFDTVTEPGFLDRVKQTSLLFKQRLAEVKDHHPSTIAEIRGDGLLLGMRMNVPNGEMVDALRAEKMLVVAAGDNVVRLLPPLNISDAEVGEAIARIDRAATALEKRQKGTMA